MLPGTPREESYRNVGTGRAENVACMYVYNAVKAELSLRTFRPDKPGQVYSKWELKVFKWSTFESVFLCDFDFNLFQTHIHIFVPYVQLSIFATKRKIDVCNV